MNALYDKIGKTYAEYRQPDRRIAARILRALDGAQSVVNVGAGAGSYEPTDRQVIAVEPSETLIRERGAQAPPVVQAPAECLPFQENSFDAAMAILTVHHWSSLEEGLAELARVTRNRLVILTWEPTTRSSWLTQDYFPEIWERDITQFPLTDYYQRQFEKVAVESVPIPHDCTDGFLEAYWRRPEAYFNESARGAISSFALAVDIDDGLSRLRRDLDDGTWHRRYGHLLERSELDLGYRLLTVDLS